MVSKNQLKIITGLHQKKYRKQHGLFIAEGIKVIQELRNSNFELHHLYTTATDHLSNIDSQSCSVITENELKKISALTNPNACLAVFRIPAEKPVDGTGLIVALDDIRDPGNLGTIIRLCDWFGIRDLVCSEQCADVYNPKVVQATMGSLARVNVVYADLFPYLQDSALPVFGTFMDGDNVYTTDLPGQGIIVFGNEANGISSVIEQVVSKRISIPRFGNVQKTESLNVATAAAILLSEFRRNSSGK